MNISGEPVEFVFFYFRIGKAAGAVEALSSAKWKRCCVSRYNKFKGYQTSCYLYD